MNMRLTKYILAALALCSLAACNNDDDKDLTSVVQANSVAVTAFNIKANEKILENLDSVFFSIDLEKAEIYNADSLPKGTDVSRLQLNIKTPTVSVCRISYRPAGSENDTTVNYLASQTDSIDFSQGPARLEIVSEDGNLSRTYTVKVNVHLSEPDSMYWEQGYKRALPTSLASVVAQRTISHNGYVLCLTQDASGRYCIAKTEHPLSDWKYSSAQLPAGAQVRQLNSWGEKLAVIDRTGALWTSSDNGATWNAEGHTVHHIYGEYNGNLLCSQQTADGWMLLSLPGGETYPIPEGMPVDGTSQLLVYTTKWAQQPLGLIVGGRLADGTPVGATWAFDGSQCAKISVGNELPGVYGMTVVPYNTFQNNNIWQVTEKSALLAFGGVQAGASIINRVVYISTDRGIHWSAAGPLLQLPSYIPAFYDADGLVVSSEMSISSEWQPQPATKLPPWLTPTAQSRVAEAVTTWECPAVYIFGGLNSNAETFNTVWHGVINRLTFRPLY